MWKIDHVIKMHTVQILKAAMNVNVVLDFRAMDTTVQVYIPTVAIK